MAFVKLDCGILDSTLWVDLECREIFITALLMAEPFETQVPLKQLDTHTMKETGWEVPPGWYGFVAAAGSGIVRRAGIDLELGTAALSRLGNPELGSRSPDFEGRRMVRVSGGYVILNYMKYRERDYTAAERQRRYRERKMALRRDVTALHRDITQAEAEAEAYSETPPQKISSSSSESGAHAPDAAVPGCPPESAGIHRSPPMSPDVPRKQKSATRIPVDFVLTEPRKSYVEKNLPNVDAEALMEQFRDHWAAKPGPDARKLDWDAVWRNWVRNANGFGYPTLAAARKIERVIRRDWDGNEIHD